MLTGELRSRIDRIWDAFWLGGISNPLEVIEQITAVEKLKAAQGASLAELDGLFASLQHRAFRGKL